MRTIRWWIALGMLWGVLLMPVSSMAASIQLAWDYIQGADPDVKFRIYSLISATCAGGWLAIADVSVPTQTYLDATLTPGLTYCYRVTALDSAGQESVPSNTVSFLVPQGTPAAPTQLRGTVIP